MKLKYYLRGLGIGIITATIILMIAFAMRGSAISDEEIIRRAKNLGMIMQGTEEMIPSGTEIEKSEVESTEILNTESKDSEHSNTEVVDTENISNEANSSVTQVYTEFVVEKGDSSNMVANKLYSAGLVDDPNKFNDYMVEQKYDNFVQPGSVNIPSGATYEELAQLLIAKPEDRK